MRGVAGLFLLLAGCGAPSDIAAVVPSENARGELRLDWERGVGAFSELLRPAHAGGAVCAVNARGEAFFLNPETGGDIAPPFRIFNGGGVVSGGAGCDGRTIAAAREDGVLAVYDLGGEELWRMELNARITSPPLIDGGALFLLGQDGRLGAYSARRGAALWKFVSPLKNLLRTPLDSSPSASGGVIYAGIDNGAVAALRRGDGRVKWITRLAAARSSNSFSNILDVTTPAAGGGLVCAASYQGHLGCMDAAEGTLLWRKPFSAVRRAAMDIDGARMFAVSIGGEVHAYVARSGELLWKIKTKNAAAAAFVRGALIVGFRDNKIAALAPDDGRVLSVVRMNGGVTHLEPLSEDSVLGATIGGEIFRATFVF